MHRRGQGAGDAVEGDVAEAFRRLLEIYGLSS